MALCNTVKLLGDGYGRQDLTSDGCPDLMKFSCESMSVGELVAGVAVTPHLSDEAIALAQSIFAEAPALMNK